MIAMALACRPRCCWPDEPTTALDVTLRQQILELLADLSARTAWRLLITHDLNLGTALRRPGGGHGERHLVGAGPGARRVSSSRSTLHRQLMASRPDRDVQDPRGGEPPVMQAQQLRVSYRCPSRASRLVPQGRVRRGAGRAVSGAAGRHAGHRRRIGSGKSTLALAALGLIPHQGELDVVGTRWGRTRQQPRDPAAGAGGVPGPVLLAVAAHDGGGDRRRGPAGARAGAGRWSSGASA
jgi:microcin C transport system ATP-binding protein